MTWTCREKGVDNKIAELTKQMQSATTENVELVSHKRAMERKIDFLKKQLRCENVEKWKLKVQVSNIEHALEQEAHDTNELTRTWTLRARDMKSLTVEQSERLRQTHETNKALKCRGIDMEREIHDLERKLKRAQEAYRKRDSECTALHSLFKLSDGKYFYSDYLPVILVV